MLLIVELRQRAAKQCLTLLETQESLFLWLKWLAVLLMGVYAQHATATMGSHKMAAKLQLIGWQRHMYIAILLSLLWYGHPCYRELAPVKAGYPLTSKMWPYCGLKFNTHQGHMLLSVDCWPIAGFWLDHWLMSKFLLILG